MVIKCLTLCLFYNVFWITLWVFTYGSAADPYISKAVLTVSSFILRVADFSDFTRGHWKYIADDAEHVKYKESESTNSKISTNRVF